MVFLPLALLAFAPPQPGTVIRTTTRLVQVHVFARASDGSAVTNLRKEDFQIFDDDRNEQPLALFIAEGKAPPSSGPSGLAAASATPSAAGFTVLLLDWRNAAIADRLRGNDAVRKVLHSFQPRQQVALYVLGLEPPNVAHPLRLIANFTADAPALAAIIEDPGMLPAPEVVDPDLQIAARPAKHRTPISVEEQLLDWQARVLDTTRALTDLADVMSRLPGRKSIIWLTTGFPMMINGGVIPGARPAEASYLHEVDQVLARFNRHDIAVHSIDTAGLASATRSFDGTLIEFATRTGGTAFYERNDLHTGVRTAFEDLQSGYTVGFLVPDDAPPGIHRLQVHTKKPHVQLRFRESYQLDPR